MEVNLLDEKFVVTCKLRRTSAPQLAFKIASSILGRSTPPLVNRMANNENYWYEEGAYAFKAGIDLVDLEEHFPTGKMTKREWRSLQTGWVAKQNEFFESMGQGRLF